MNPSSPPSLVATEPLQEQHDFTPATHEEAEHEESASTSVDWNRELRASDEDSSSVAEFSQDVSGNVTKSLAIETAEAE